MEVYMNRKILSVFIALCVLLTATGCENNAPAATTPAETTATTTTAAETTTTAAEDDEEDEEDDDEEDDDEEDDDEEDDDEEDDASWLDDDDESDESDDEGGYDDDESGSQTSGSGFPYDASLGTAKELDGNIAIVSVFINSSYYPWKYEDLTNSEAYKYYGQGLRVGTEYLEKECAKYGHHPKFIWDWSEHYDLFVYADLDIDPGNSDYVANDNTAWEYIENNIDTAAILNETDAQQMIYMFVYNTPTDCAAPSVTRNYYEGMAYPYEICYITAGYSGYYIWPGAVAHEILHTFGAPDLYLDWEYGITKEFVDYAEKIKLNDIMRINWDADTKKVLYDRINNEITEMTAYYAGMTDYSETVEQWGFEPSQHVSR